MNKPRWFTWMYKCFLIWYTSDHRGRVYILEPPTASDLLRRQPPPTTTTTATACSKLIIQRFPSWDVPRTQTVSLTCTWDARVRGDAPAAVSSRQPGCDGVYDDSSGDPGLYHDQPVQILDDTLHNYIDPGICHSSNLCCIRRPVSIQKVAYTGHNKMPATSGETSRLHRAVGGRIWHSFSRRQLHHSQH